MKRKRFTSDRVYLTGSRRTIQRIVFEENGLYYVKWYGEYIQVAKAATGYYTVEPY